MKEKKPVGRQSPHPVEYQMRVARKVPRGSGNTEKETTPIPKPRKESEATVIGRMETHVKELKAEIAGYQRIYKQFLRDGLRINKKRIARTTGMVQAYFDYREVALVFLEKRAGTSSAD